MDDLISRQAAIESICKVTCGRGYCGMPCDEVKAIEQLPSAQPEPCEDAVGRKAIVELVSSWLNHAGYSEGEINVMRCVIQSVQDMPSAQPRPRGRWLPDNRNYYEERFVCSVCERSYEVDTCMGDPTWDFCPGCGADMRTEVQDEQ